MREERERGKRSRRGRRRGIDKIYTCTWYIFHEFVLKFWYTTRAFPVVKKRKKEYVSDVFSLCPFTVCPPFSLILPPPALILALLRPLWKLVVSGTTRASCIKLLDLSSSSLSPPFSLNLILSPRPLPSPSPLLPSLPRFSALLIPAKTIDWRCCR